LQDDPVANTVAFGCRECPDLGSCGGLHTEAGIFDCRDFCSCVDPSQCDIVCRAKSLSFFQRYIEVQGFDLHNVPRSNTVQAPTLPEVVPFVGDRHSRLRILNEPVVALSLYKLLHLGSGELIVRTRKDLSSRFLIPEDARVILTGVDRDRRVEGWWGLSTRPEILAGLRALEISLITSPNFSLFTNVPRPDNLHAMKRIALAWEEMNSAGIATALHVNARTYQDYKRWTDFIEERPEVTHIAFEFGTGAGRAARLDWHVERLVDLSTKVGRPLKLVLRGGWRALTLLRATFEQVTLIETEAFSRTMRRRRATINEAGRLRWRAAPTAPGIPLDALLASNVSMVRLGLTLPFERHRAGSERCRRVRRRAANTDREALQQSLLPELDGPPEARTVSTDD
jgi:hypothetical protein